MYILYQSKQCFVPLAIKKEGNTKSSAETASSAVINSCLPSCLTRRFLRPRCVTQRVRGEIPITNPFSSTLVMCHGPLPVVTLGKKELTFEPHSTQDLEALGDVGLLWNARCSPGCGSPGCADIKNLEPHDPAPKALQPQPCQPVTACTRNPGPRLEPEALQPLPRQQADRLKRPPRTEPPLVSPRPGMPKQQATTDRPRGTDRAKTRAREVKERR